MTARAAGCGKRQSWVHRPAHVCAVSALAFAVGFGAFGLTTPSQARAPKRAAASAHAALAPATAAALPVASTVRTAAPNDRSASASIVKSGNLARDCVGQAELTGSRAIRFVVWCSVQSGRFSFDIQRGKGGRQNPIAPILAFTPRPKVTGVGAQGAASCHLGPRKLRCRGHKTAQVTVRGRLVVPAGTRCAVPVRIESADVTSGGQPIGCPGRGAGRADFEHSYMRSFRAQFGLLANLHGDRAAIRRRIDRAVRSWRRGEPVARVTASEIGMPLLPFEQRKLEFRGRFLERNVDALERWLAHRSTDTFAGYELVDRWQPILYVGFTGDQEAQLAAFKTAEKLVAPGRVRPFPRQPLYAERQLWDLGEEIIESGDSELSTLVNSVGVATLANKVEVGTKHVDELKRLLAERFGSDAPFLVVFERPGMLL